MKTEDAVKIANMALDFCQQVNETIGASDNPYNMLHEAHSNMCKVWAMLQKDEREYAAARDECRIITARILNLCEIISKEAED